mmetsp:Transcript_18171/g.50577  ORF Transcript_18171/g.50577 Transcript_18171/m.50577 type:complete len:135 (-) Transcript_18171:257-661(-)
MPHPSQCSSCTTALSCASALGLLHNRRSISVSVLPQPTRSMWQVQLAEQEETIGHLGQAVGRLKQLGGAMNAELASQNAMLNDLESGLDETASGMDALKNKMKALMPKKEPKQKMAIVILSIILVVLLFLVAYT